MLAYLHVHCKCMDNFHSLTTSLNFIGLPNVILTALVSLAIKFLVNINILAIVCSKAVQKPYIVGIIESLTSIMYK